jgi:putative ABC transport system substrate-binding protein
VRRRSFLTGALTITAISPATAQQRDRSQRLAIFSPSEPITLMNENSKNLIYRALFGELRRLGHVEGQNLSVERYGREQDIAGPPALATEVIRSNPDVIYVVGPGVLLFKAPASSIPIVALTADPLGQGLAQSLAHPGGNVTGVSVDAGPSIYGKRIELLRQIVPALSKLAFLALRVQWESAQGAAMRAAADTAGLAWISSLVELPTSETIYRAAIDDIRRRGAQAIVVADNPDTAQHRDPIVDAIAETRLPAMFAIRDFVNAGGLIAYAFDIVELNQRAARDIDAILRGTKPGDIPFYQASRFTLSVNLKTAAALGLTVPQSLLAQADEVIE